MKQLFREEHESERRGMQMLAWTAFVLLAFLLGLALSDWLTGHDTIAGWIRGLS